MGRKILLLLFPVAFNVFLGAITTCKASLYAMLARSLVVDCFPLDLFTHIVKVAPSSGYGIQVRTYQDRIGQKDYFLHVM